MAGLTADQIIERIANANGIAPKIMRQYIEFALENIITDTSQPHYRMLAALFPNREPSTDELVVALEHALYETMMPKLPGWQWDGECYQNVTSPGK